MGVMDSLTALIGITLPVPLTNWLTSKQTQRIIENLTVRPSRSCTTPNRWRRLYCCLVKLDFGFEANARMHG